MLYRLSYGLLLLDYWVLKGMTKPFANLKPCPSNEGLESFPLIISKAVHFKVAVANVAVL